MKQATQAYCLLQIDSFLNFLKVKVKPEIAFVSRPTIQECKVNDFMECVETDTIYFNLDFLDRLPEEYMIVIVLHEVYHYTLQGIQDINQVTWLRDRREWMVMQFCDIEADIQVVIYLHHAGLISSFADYCSIVYSGTNTFRDKVMRLPKIERFIGSIVSIKNYFETGGKTIYLPHLFYQSGSLYIIDFSRSVFRFQFVELKDTEYLDWKIVFQDASLLTVEEYCKLLDKTATNFIITTAKSAKDEKREFA